MRRLLVCIVMVALLSGCGADSSSRASIQDAVTSIEQQGSWSFSLAGEPGQRREIPLSLNKPGLVRADVQWDSESNSRLALLVFRAGTPGAYARTDGEPPHLRLYWTLPPDLAASTEADEWRLAVVNLQATPVVGTLSIRLEPMPTP